MFNLKKQMLKCFIHFSLVALGVCVHIPNAAAAESTPALGYKIISKLPHDPALYTEGLVFHDGKLLESAGQYGESGLYEVEIKTGKILRSRKIEPQFFGEGIALANNRIVQLTWREHTAFVYDLAFNQLDTLSYDMEGWGLASFNNDKEIVMSDGTPTLRFIDAIDYHGLRQVTVHDGSKEIVNINELETAKGLIYANVWLTDTIAVIDPADGHVVAWLDLSRLKTLFPKPEKWDNADNVLNGIAYDPRSDHFYVTGKRWPVMFEITIDKLSRSH